ncbi:MAG TPA: ABC transporter ATP-binding protein [Desulfurococcales archaeon]|nr:ABC transporter ATP-binding protein [Desulfurococcales archaeon]
MRKVAIEVHDLWFKYNHSNEWVLKGINLTVKVGEKVAILGENGSGKTTLIKHFNGLLKPCNGVVKVFGVDTRFASVAKLARRVGIVFQNPLHQFFSETVWDEVAYALYNFGYSEEEIERRVEYTLKLMDLYDLRYKSPFTLSGGEMRRLALASILVYNPDIIVIDEPTIGQDAKHKRKLAEILNTLANMGKTVIVVTHDIEFAIEYFPRIIVLSSGKIIADGSPNKIIYDDNIVNRANIIRPPIISLIIELSKRYNVDVDLSKTKFDEIVREIINIIRRKESSLGIR